MKIHLIYPNLPHSFFLCVALICGVLLTISSAYTFVLIFSAIVTILFLSNSKKPITQQLFLTSSILAFLLIGFTRTKYLKLKNKELSDAISDNKEPLEAEVINIEPHHHTYFKNAITLRAKISPHQTGLIKIYTHNIDELKIYDQIKLKETCFKKHDGEASLYTLKESLTATKFTKEIKYTKQPNKKNIWKKLKKKLFLYKDHLSKRIKAKTSKLSWTMFTMIFLGKKTLNTCFNKVKNSFQNWGISHYLARSGLHVLLILIIWTFLLNCLPINYKLKQMFLGIVILTYNILTWSSLSFERSVITFLLYKICVAKDLPLNTINTLSITGLLVLINNPFHVYFLDFQLTFALTLALAIYNEISSTKKHL